MKKASQCLPAPPSGGGCVVGTETKPRNVVVSLIDPTAIQCADGDGGARPAKSWCCRWLPHFIGHHHGHRMGANDNAGTVIETAPSDGTSLKFPSDRHRR